MKQNQLKAKQPKKTQNPKEKTFLEHLTELKNRFFVWFLFLLLFSALGYFLYPTILNLLVKPLGKPLYYTSPVGGFEVVFNTSLFFGFIASLPILLYQLIVFIRPSFGTTSLTTIFKLVLASFTLAIIGITICYLLILPPSLNFLGQFGGRELTALISTNDYFSFVIKYLTSFAIIFQMPLVMLLINNFTRLKVKTLLLNFRYVFLTAYIVSAILTPTPDLINQTIMATPILLLYLFSVILVAALPKNPKPVAKV